MLNRSWVERSDFAATSTAIILFTERARHIVSRLLAASLIRLIDAYRTCVSPLIGPHCRFHPTCSQYAVEAIQKVGPVHGTALAIVRLSRCHPLSEGGYDPVR